MSDTGVVRKRKANAILLQLLGQWTFLKDFSSYMSAYWAWFGKNTRTLFALDLEEVSDVTSG